MTSDGPLTASAYALLGVAPTVDDDELRRAYRLRLRQTHPDTGGDAALFVRVQRAWELIGTPQARSAYDQGRAAPSWQVPAGSSRRPGTRPGTKTHGLAGAWSRRRYRQLLAEHLGYPPADAEAFSAAVVRAAPVEVRRMLAQALAEESTAETLADLGLGYAAWHDVRLGREAGADGGAAGDAEVGKLDHVVLGPTGLYAVASLDLGGPARFRRGEVLTADGATPAADLLSGLRTVARAARVRFSAALLVLPDDDLVEPVTMLGSVGEVRVAATRRSVLRTVLRSGIPGTRSLGGNELFDIRTRLTQTAAVLTP